MPAPHLRLPAPLRTAARLALLGASLSGCVNHIANGAVEGAIDGAASDQSRADIARILADPKLQEAVKGLGRAIVNGSLKGLDDKELNAEVQKTTGEFVESLMPILTEILHRDLGPAVQTELKSAIRATLDEALSKKTTVSAQALAKAVVQTTMETLRQQLGDALVDDIGPSLQIMMENNLGPGVHNMLNDEIGPGVDEMLTLHVLPPVINALDDQRGAIVSDLDRVMNKGQDTLRTVTQVLTGVASFLVILLAIAGWGLFRFHRSNELRERTVVLLARQIREHAHEPATQALVRSIRRAGTASAEGRYLSDVLRRHEPLKVELSEEGAA